MSGGVRPAAAEGLEVRVVGAEVIVHDPARGKVHVLNRTAWTVLELCDAAHDADEIAAAIVARTGAPFERVRADVDDVLGTFRRIELVRRG